MAQTADLSQWSARDLRDVLGYLSVDVSSCFERCDFLDSLTKVSVQDVQEALCRQSLKYSMKHFCAEGPECSQKEELLAMLLKAGRAKSVAGQDSSADHEEEEEEESPLEPGTTVRLVDLRNAPALNMQRATVVRYDPAVDRYEVRLDWDGSIKKIRCDNLEVLEEAPAMPEKAKAEEKPVEVAKVEEKLAPGTTVRLVDLRNAPALNMQHATVVRYDPAADRYEVRLDGDGSIKKIRCDNLEVLEEAPVMPEKAVEEAAANKKAEEDEAKRKADEEAAAKKMAAEEEAKRKADEEAAAIKKAAEEEAKRKADEEAAAIKKAAEEEAQRKADEEAAAKTKAVEEEAKRKADEDAAAQKKAAEEEAKRKEEEQAAAATAAKLAAEEEAAKKKAEEIEAERKANEDEAKRKADAEAAAKSSNEAPSVDALPSPLRLVVSEEPMSTSAVCIPEVVVKGDAAPVEGFAELASDEGFTGLASDEAEVQDEVKHGLLAGSPHAEDIHMAPVVPTAEDSAMSSAGKRAREVSEEDRSRLGGDGAAVSEPCAASDLASSAEVDNGFSDKLPEKVAAAVKKETLDIPVIKKEISDMATISPMVSKAPKKPMKLKMGHVVGRQIDQSGRLAAGVQALFFARDFCDVTLICGELTFTAHKVVLAGQSDVLRELLKDKDSLHLAEISMPEAVQLMLDFLYEVDDETGYDPSSHQVNKDVLFLAEKFQLLELKRRGAAVLARDITTQNAMERITMCEKLGLPDIRDRILDQLASNKKALAEFTSFPEVKQHPQLLRDVLRRVTASPAEAEQISPPPPKRARKST